MIGNPLSAQGRCSYHTPLSHLSSLINIAVLNVGGGINPGILFNIAVAVGTGAGILLHAEDLPPPVQKLIIVNLLRQKTKKLSCGSEMNKPGRRQADKLKGIITDCFPNGVAAAEKFLAKLSLRLFL